MAITKEQVAKVAEKVCTAFAAGRRDILKIGRVSFNLSDVAYCARFVRECHEAALGMNEHSWAFGAADARQMEAKLKGAMCRVQSPERGDIVAFNNSGGTFGHIGIYLGRKAHRGSTVGMFAENTSSRSRGPGFVISPMATMTGRVSGYYSVLPSAETGQTVKIIEHGSGKLLATARMTERGNHITDQGKLYVTNFETT